MAIEVTSWAELLQAASGDDPTVEINLPENAEWDLGEIEPEGHTGYIKLVGQINGNGTKIKNLVLNATGSDCMFYVYGSLIDVHFVDGVWTGNVYNVVKLYGANTSVQLCTFSASVQRQATMYIFAAQVANPNKAIVYRCAINIELSQSGGVIVLSGNAEGKYNNFKISGSSVTSVAISTTDTYCKMEYSYIIFDTPAVTTVTGYKFTWSLLRCTGSNVTNLNNVSSSSGFSIACSSDFPNAGTVSQTLNLCTESQLHDAAYLQSIGFPIGV